MKGTPPQSKSTPDQPAADDATALVVVLHRPLDLQRAMDAGWYRIPLNRAPSRVAAEYLAFYQTGAFPPDERFKIRWMAPVLGYSLTTRRELIPEEPGHSRADEHYYKVLLGRLVPLPHPIPSYRLRRVTFIPTTLSRLLHAVEINDLWIRNRAQDLLWEALRQAGLECEIQYPLQDDLGGIVADFALFCRAGRIAVIISDTAVTAGNVGESREMITDSFAHASDWQLAKIGATEVEYDPVRCVRRLAGLVDSLGGLLNPPKGKGLHA